MSRMLFRGWFWLLLFLPPFTNAATLWTGPAVTFSKAPFANHVLAQNQDRLTAQVWLTRANTQGPFNIRQEPVFQILVSPGDTEWAFGTLALDVQTLSFDDWHTTVGSRPQTALNRSLVVHLLAEDIYLDLTMTIFGGGGSGGAFAYTRSSPVPTPTTLPLLLSGLGIITAMKGKRGRIKVPV